GQRYIFPAQTQIRSSHLNYIRRLQSALSSPVTCHRCFAIASNYLVKPDIYNFKKCTLTPQTAGDKIRVIIQDQNEGCFIMNKAIIGSVMFLAGLLSAAVVLAGIMAHDRTTADGDLSSFRNLTQYGLLSAFYTFIGTAIIGLVVAL
ncbi:MAG: hypothetical protein K2O34_02620, partial [Acetatifactor sp.]|nr:hypothetical protein [Acetatifactor sp.]